MHRVGITRFCICVCQKKLPPPLSDSKWCDQNGFILVPDWLKVVSYEIPEGAFQTEWQRKAYEVFLMQLALKAEKGPGHEVFFDATEPAELQEEAPQTSHSSRDEVMLKEVLQLESWPEIYRNWMFYGARGATREEMVKTLKEQKELGEPTRKRSKQAERRRLFRAKFF
ncbi:unnamed protein product [Caenorhabditis nigoni]